MRVRLGLCVELVDAYVHRVNIDDAVRGAWRAGWLRVVADISVVASSDGRAVQRLLPECAGLLLVRLGLQLELHLRLPGRHLLLLRECLLRPDGRHVRLHSVPRQHVVRRGREHLPPLPGRLYEQ